ncbi:Histone-lysine N-methyltransferase [Conglomerata obtusa]
MRRCKICFEGFHTKNEYISVCNECLICHNCGFKLANNIYKNDKTKATFCHIKNNELKIINKKIKNCNKNVIKFFESLLCENNDITNYKIFTCKSSKHNFEDVCLIYCVNCYESYVTKYELCPVCLKNYTQEDMLECEWCYKWVHYSCEENKEVIKISEKESEYEFIYKCNLCTEFEDAWLGKCKKHVEEKKSEIIYDNANCLICVRKFNAIERKLICLIKLNGINNTFVHNICALSNFEIIKNKCVIIKESHKCNKCKKMGAHVKCIFCVKMYFHFDCAFDQGCDLFRSNFIFPICQKHFFKHLNQMNTLAKNISLLEFHYNELNSLLEYRVKDYVISKDSSFIKIYYFPELCTFGFDHKYFYINNQKMKQTEIENMLLEYDVKINIDGIFNEVRDLVNTNTKLQPLQQKHFNICLDYKYQIKNYTLSFISHLLQTNKNLEIRKSNIHGKGVFATRFYYPNEVIISYEGQRITFEESDIREKKYIDANFYMFKTSEEVIDATIIGNIAKFINQSCDPNCYSTEAIWGSRRGILICAKRFITVDEELTYKYMMNGDKILCRCDALNCKKVLN